MKCIAVHYGGTCKMRDTGAGCGEMPMCKMRRKVWESPCNLHTRTHLEWVWPCSLCSVGAYQSTEKWVMVINAESQSRQMIQQCYASCC